MTTIYLIRHGDVHKYSPRRFLGQGDPELTERGRKRMAVLAESLASEQVEMVYSSPLLRCCESADIFCDHIGGSTVIRDNLAEINLGKWEGLTISEVQKHFPGKYEARGMDLQGFRPPEGESFGDLLERAWPIFEEISDSGFAKVAIVSHAGVNRVLLCHILGIPLPNMFRIQQSFACLNVVHAKNGNFSVVKMNL